MKTLAAAASLRARQEGDSRLEVVEADILQVDLAALIAARTRRADLQDHVGRREHFRAVPDHASALLLVLGVRKSGFSAGPGFNHPLDATLRK